MDRRRFMGLLGLAGLAAGVSPALRRRLFAQTMGNPDTALQPYTGRLYLFVHAGGGWDPTMVCDPKGGDINHQFMPGQIAHAGNIAYAPVTYGGGYAARTFFEKFQNRLLVLNGIDMTTNNHDGGTRFTWSGRLEDGYPPLAGLIAAALAPGKPLGFLSNGGYDYTAGVVPLTRLQGVDTIARIAFPNRADPNNMDSVYHSAATRARIAAAQNERLSAMAAAQTLPVYRNSMLAHLSTRGGANLLEQLMQFLPTNDELNSARNNAVYYQGLIALGAYRAGVTAAVNLSTGGFDTHSDHDNQQGNALGNLLSGVDRLMDKIDALGLQDRVVLVVGSDFGRTPTYNSNNNGKDHWAVTSMLMMGAGIQGNRVVGGSDDHFRARNLDLASLQATDAGDKKLSPTGIHLAMRRFAGVENAEIMRQFPIAGDTYNGLFG